MKKYETYKESGLEWLGCVPEHWEVMRLKFCSTIVLGKMLMSTPPENQEESYTLEKYIKSKNVGWLSLNVNEDDVEEMYFNEIEKGIYKLKEGDIVMNEGGDIGKVALWHHTNYDCYIQNSINKITPSEKLNSAFLTYWLYNVSMTGYFWSIVSQISIAHLTKEKLANTPVVLPPLSEQLTIASFLDYKVSQIDVLIAEKEKMVADLKAYRSSVITEAVTKGLDRNAEMKESGVEWIKEIPSTWNILPLKRCAAIMTGGTPSTEKSKYWEAPTFPWYTPGDFSDEDIVLQESSRKLDMHAVEDHAAKVFPEDSVLVVGIGATVGKIGIATTECSANQQVNAVTFAKSVLPLFGAYYLYAAKKYVRAQCNSATLPILNQTTMGELKIVLPPLDEQKQITQLIQQKVSVIKSSVSEIEHELSDLKSYKSSLITEAVTGKIDLRGWEQQKE